MSMANNTVLVSVPDCEICNNEPARVRCIVTDPLVDSHSTYVGENCYAVNAGAIAILRAREARLVITEVSA